MDRYVVFGNPIGHSKSPMIHKLFAEQTGQRLDYTTLLAPLDGFSACATAFFRKVVAPTSPCRSRKRPIVWRTA